MSANSPGSPTTLTAMTGNTKMYLSWTAPTSDGGSTVTDYKAEYSSDSGNSWSTFSDEISTSTFVEVTGLTNASAYTFRVSAINDVGTGTPSDTATATPVSPTLQGQNSWPWVAIMAMS
jgi:hypothetical protein